MVNIGSTVVYGSQICKVEETRKMTLGKVTRDYYVLAPVFDAKNVIYVPCDNEALLAKMKKVLSAEEIYALIDAIPDKDSVWIEDSKLRRDEYKKIIEQGSREEIMAMIKTLFEHKTEMEAKGRKLHATDEILLSRAEKVIYEEFALVLDIKKEEVVPFIAKQIEIKEKK